MGMFSTRHTYKFNDTTSYTVIFNHSTRKTGMTGKSFEFFRDCMNLLTTVNTGKSAGMKNDILALTVSNKSASFGHYISINSLIDLCLPNSLVDGYEALMSNNCHSEVGSFTHRKCGNHSTGVPIVWVIAAEAENFVAKFKAHPTIASHINYFKKMLEINKLERNVLCDLSLPICLSAMANSLTSLTRLHVLNGIKTKALSKTNPPSDSLMDAYTKLIKPLDDIHIQNKFDEEVTDAHFRLFTGNDPNKNQVITHSERAEAWDVARGYYKELLGEYIKLFDNIIKNVL